MTIDEAIKLLQLDLGDPGSVDYDDRANAQQLGIEALKYVKMQESWRHTLVKSLLFGETKEVK